MKSFIEGIQIGLITFLCIYVLGYVTRSVLPIPILKQIGFCNVVFFDILVYGMLELMLLVIGIALLTAAFSK
jgi:hypothetical protein